MRIQISDIIDRHTGIPAVITLHGPTLNLHKEKIIDYQKQGKILRFSVNNWYDYFDLSPSYWILSSSEQGFPIRKMLPIIMDRKMPMFFSDDGDFTSKKLIDDSLDSEWLVYDQRHWQGKTCLEILKAFKQHHTINKNFDFKKFGNNSAMWKPPRCYTMSGHSLEGRCCDQNVPTRIPIQEELQNLSGHDSHYSTGDTVALHAIAFAILMGCNPIYVAVLDLDYNKGYANKDLTDWDWKAKSVNAWTPVRENLENDLNILNASALKRNINILNLNPNPWYNSFNISGFDL